MSLWRGAPLVLASKSSVRRSLLEAAGIPVQVDAADIDERAVEAPHAGEAPLKIALLLARAKAEAVAKRRPSALVLGADQTLALGNRRFSKPTSVASARAQLVELSAKSHALYSGVAVARDGTIVFEAVSSAQLTMRALSDAALDAYLAAAGPRVQESVGGYQLEGLGVHLFERIEGDHFTILGLPLLPLLAWFRGQGLLP